MPRKRGDSRLPRWQNKVSSEVALYSRPPACLCTEKLMVVGCDGTPSSSSKAVKCG